MLLLSLSLLLVVASASPIATSSGARNATVAGLTVNAAVASVLVNPSETVQILASPTITPTPGTIVKGLGIAAQTVQPFPTNPTTAKQPIPQTINLATISLSFSASPPEMTYSRPSKSTTTPAGQSSAAPVPGRSSSAAPPAQPSSAAPPAQSSSAAPPSASSSAAPAPGSQNIFAKPIDTSAPPALFARAPPHPVQPLSIRQQDLSLPIETNKFYANFFLGTQLEMMWTQPFGLWWNKDQFGISISHTERSQLSFGPQTPGAPAGTNSYYINPIKIASMGLHASEFDSSTQLQLDTLDQFSINVNLVHTDGRTLTVPSMQGQAFITGKYTGLTPVIRSGVFFKTFAKVSSSRSGLVKYRVTLQDGNNWLIYGVQDAGSAALDLQISGNDQLAATSAFTGIVQIAKIPAGNSVAEGIYDSHAGTYVTSATLSGSVSGNAGSYQISYGTSGSSPSGLLMFAMAHHLASLAPSMQSSLVNINLTATTKGMMQAYSGSALVLQESSMPTDVEWLPWMANGQASTYSPDAIKKIAAAANDEMTQDMSAQSNSNSMYFAGKTLAKFAYICLAVNDIVQDQTVAQQCVSNLKAAFARFSNNQQTYPLWYDETWKGIVSSGAYKTGQPLEDFGNTYYNDHHFHYAYHVQTAAIIGHIDPTWAAGNKEYVNSLIRDIANPTKDDTYFPVSRSFDWFNGHSWAKGLFESADGKDQESSSEDLNFAYALKLWGMAIGDADMEARGNLMCAVMRRSFNSYFLMQSDNTIQPPSFINNKVTGILFDNKVDHTTYFGTNIEYIEGIHMIPLTPISGYVRQAKFVAEEWNQYFKDTINTIVGGWRGILYANLALIDAKTSYQFFAQDNFDSSLLDGGASLTWYLAYTSGLGGAA